MLVFCNPAKSHMTTDQKKKRGHASDALAPKSLPWILFVGILIILNHLNWLVLHVVSRFFLWLVVITNLIGIIRVTIRVCVRVKIIV